MVKCCRGFTLIQLLAALGVVFLLIQQAMPDWRGAARQQQAMQLAQRFVVLLKRAKSEALLRHQPVYVCAANLKLNRDLQGCLSSPRRDGSWHVWEEGVLAFIDKPGGRDALYDSKEAMQQLATESALLHVSSRQFAVSASGRLGTAVHFRVKHGDGHCWQWRFVGDIRLEEETCSA